MANNIDIDVDIEIGHSLRNGMSIRQVCAKFKISKNTALKRRDMLVRNGVAFKPCGCGRPSGHKGWCHVLYAKSPKRQAFMKIWGRGPRVKLDKPILAE